MKTYTLDDLQKLLPDFIDEKYPKGSKNGDKDRAIIPLALYILWLREREVEGCFFVNYWGIIKKQITS